MIFGIGMYLVIRIYAIFLILYNFISFIIYDPHTKGDVSRGTETYGHPHILHNWLLNLGKGVDNFPTTYDLSRYQTFPLESSFANQPDFSFLEVWVFLYNIISDAGFLIATKNAMKSTCFTVIMETMKLWMGNVSSI